MENKANRIIWHHSADTAPGHQADKINRWHRSLKFPLSILGFYGGYHILIEKDGSIFRYRADNEIGAHDAGENVNSLGICLAGNFNLENPTKEQETSFVKQLNEWMLKWNIPANRIDPHRMGDHTDCPGKLLSDEYPRELLKNTKPNKTNEILLDLIKYIQSKLDA